ncbi:MAG: class I SAM-dependent methyltransferase [Candidatus Beckwithbacteria bacterium]
MKFDQATLLWRGVEVGLLKKKWGRNLKGKILDLGCGEGKIAREVFARQLEWGLDNDKEMIKRAKKCGVYKKVIWGDGTKINLPSRVVNVVFSNSVLEHIKDIDGVLSEIKRVLKPKGLLIATMPSDKLGEYLGWGKLYAAWFNHKYHHYNLLSLSGWQKRLKKHGLSLIDGYYYLNKATIRQWHRLLWLNKLGLKGKIKPPKLEVLIKGAALAIMAQKIT